jgi:hypothetical protein
MQLLTIKGGWSMNRRLDIKNGTVRIIRDDRPQETTLTVKDWLVKEAEDVVYLTGDAGDRTVTTKEKDEEKRVYAIRTISRYEDYWNLPAEGVFHEVHGLKIGRFKGILHQLSRKSRFVREEFVYENGQIAYVWTPYRKRLRLHRPNGSLWMEITAKVRRPWKRMEHFLEKINATLDNIVGDGHTWSKQPDYEVRLYDHRGKQSGYGKVANHQRTGIWWHGKAKYYFLMGVSVSERIYHAKPDDLDPLEVLRTDNAQLRAALMKKIGPERLLRKLPFAACDEDGENRLLKADTRSISGSDAESMGRTRVQPLIDDHIAIAELKCPSTSQLYYLRVPPRLKNVEHARQWLCGIDIESVEQEYIRDSWARVAGGDLSRLPAHQQIAMNHEIEQAKQRQRLEFVSEA